MAANDGSRVEAAEAGVHAEQREHGAHDHVDAVDSVATGHHDHDDHDDHGGGHGGHGADPNEGVLRGAAPTPAWLLTTAGITVLTVVLCILLAVKIG